MEKTDRFMEAHNFNTTVTAALKAYRSRQEEEKKGKGGGKEKKVSKTFPLLSTGIKVDFWGGGEEEEDEEKSLLFDHLWYLL